RSESTNRRGNQDLDVENADTFTLGLVLTGPGRFENFIASFDYYKISIDNAIAPIDAVFVYAQCFNANGQSNPDLVIDDPGGFCRMITRDPVDGERQLVDA